MAEGDALPVFAAVFPEQIPQPVHLVPGKLTYDGGVQRDKQGFPRREGIVEGVVGIVQEVQAGLFCSPLLRKDAALTTTKSGEIFFRRELASLPLLADSTSNPFFCKSVAKEGISECFPSMIRIVASVILVS